VFDLVVLLRLEKEDSIPSLFHPFSAVITKKISEGEGHGLKSDCVSLTSLSHILVLSTSRHRR